MEYITYVRLNKGVKMANYSDLIYQPGVDTRQGNAVKPTSFKTYAVVNRGDPVSYGQWYATYSGKFRSQILVISGS